MSTNSIKDKDITVWFSCGAASAVAAKKTIDIYGRDNRIRVVNTPVDEEDSDNKRFLKDVEFWIGQKIETAINPNFFSSSVVDVWDKKKYMSGVYGAPCTKILKKEARYYWEKNNKSDFIVLGFTSEEKQRHERFTLTERSNVIPVLIDLELTKKNCVQILLQDGIKLPRVYDLGFPNANCIGCVKSSSPTYWNLVRKTYPEVFKQRSEQSRSLGCRLVVVKGERIFLDELSEDQKGADLKYYGSDCGIFCEEK